MPLPVDNLTSVHLDAATDDPSQARPELLAAINKIKELIAALSVTPGVDKVPAHDANANIQLGRIAGIGKAPDTDHTASMQGVFEIGNWVVIYSDSSSAVGFSRNAKYTTNWVYKNTGQEAQLIILEIDGSYRFWTAPSGTAGATISWVEKLLIPNAAGATTYMDGGFECTNDIKTYRASAIATGIIFLGLSGAGYLYYNGSNYELGGVGVSLVINGGTAWHSGNDGINSGLDANLLNGLASSAIETANTVVVRGGFAGSSIRATRFSGNNDDNYIASYDTGYVQGNPTFQIIGGADTGPVLTATFDSISGPYSSPPGRAALVIGRNTVTGRSIAALGTLVASGADYAEYEIKSDHCGIVAKGQIIGFDASGKITDKWANALSFGIKTTAPSYVGGDTWGTPDVIGCEYPVLPVEPCEPQCLPTPKSLRHAKHRHDEAVRHADMAKAALAAMQKDVDKEVFDQAQKNLVAAELAMTEAAATLCDEEDRAKNAQEKIDSDHRAACEKYTADCETYKADKAIYDERLEAARSKVDRVAYSGKVPCNVEGAVPGDYIVPVIASGGGISGKAISEQNITFAEYRRAVGRVRKILDDGRPEVAVIVH